MPPSYSTTELHTLLSGPHATHACLTLYDECPHTRHSSSFSSSSSSTATPYPKAAYLHCKLPPVHSPQAMQNPDYELETHETTRTRFSHRKENPQAGRLARLVLSKHSPVVRHTRSARQPTCSPVHPQLPPLLGALPTIYVLSFSTDRTPSARSFAHLRTTHLPPHLPLLCTMDARSFLVPPAQLCAVYSGVAPAVQEAVVRDARARAEIGNAVRELVGFVRAGREVGIAVCCTAGTHRSVAIAELVALGVRSEVRRRGSRDGVKVVVRHVHRVRGVEDPY